MKLIRLLDLKKKTGLKNTKLYELVSKGDLPKPVKIGRASLWLESEVDEWIARKAEERFK